MDRVQNGEELCNNRALVYLVCVQGWATQRTDSCCLSLRPGVQGLFSASCIEGSSLDARSCSAATLSRYCFILCESRGQRALNVLLCLVYARVIIMVVRTCVSSGGFVEGCCGFPIWQG